MPAKTEKQKRFFGAVMGAKKGQKGVSGAAKKAAKGMTKKQIKDFLKKESIQIDESKKAKKITQQDVLKGIRKKMPPPSKSFGKKGYQRHEKHKQQYNEGMTFKEFFIINEKHCWTGYRKVGMKKKGGKMVNDCRKVKK